MREILFRGKRVEDGKWICGYLYEIWERVYILWGMTNGVPDMVEVIPETVDEWTGCKDRNGKEIYEGDIVTFTHHLTGYREEPEVVEWSGTLSAFIVRAKDDQWDYLAMDEYEIIGNIHDNPELFGKKEINLADDKLFELGFKLVSAIPRVGAWVYENPDDDHEVEIDFDGEEWILHSNTISHEEDCFGQLFNRPVGLKLIEMRAFMAKIEELEKEDRYERKNK